MDKNASECCGETVRINPKKENQKKTMKVGNRVYTEQPIAIAIMNKEPIKKS